MSGHSKWHNIQGRKNAQDAKRGKIFQKISRELYMAVKAGGPDPSSNPQLRLIMDKARAANMPKDNVKHAVDKGSNTDTANYEEVTYEGYAPGGVAVLVHALTDNKNRTSSNVRVAFTRNGGALGASGSVAYMFDRRGYIVIEREDLDVDEDQMLEDALETGADDMETSDEAFEIYTDPKQLAAVRDALEAKGYKLANAELTMIPENTTPVPTDKVEQFERMIDLLEDDDDVSEVYHTGELPDNEDAK
ncbi:YebC/PmpR family DNA-binding transcriptional regulator [Loigolactobacillus backii]|uniref:Probable transcriptional regulatory protein AYR53_11130 n=1 Tax=Loigolactobacillus backii TaxID=375175 RepID=A0A192H5K6_9LACO|nr:YebC/PmpR family DNA-binding transcriptional regulator [Loigolactobacillus backii]ANK59936.1 transcriptional regulator [Loigolactobacillus backii]ANK63271.1 transcriptional regulator [Loigolactobacillus backii]ANK64870.1 transcriptional regulator [Loigolactobacillus backii]ANK66683.1 transcriptional regulator [Loigolactobacillus backii]ANK69723.1 transcriptional regulator [Loigolactobacillus backii]